MDEALKNERKRVLKVRAQARASKGSRLGSPLVLLIIVGLLLAGLAYRFGTTSQIFAIVSLSCGWFVAYYSSNWNAKQNTVVQLRQAACKDVVKKAAASEQKLATLAGNLYGIESGITHSLDPVTAPYLPLKLDSQKHLKEWEEYQKAYMDFLYAYSENEILLLQLEPFRIAVLEEQNKLAEAHSRFVSTLMMGEAMLKANPNAKPPKDNIQEALPEMKKLLLDQACYLHDFRIELLNFGLGELLGCSIPRREPSDKSFTTLAQLAKQFQ